MHGTLHPGPVLLLANHVSWLDIVAIQSIHPVRFVSKANVRRWPLIGRLAKSAGTLFIERHRPRDALRVVHEISDALYGGGVVVVFQKGTTGAGATVLPFHSNLVQAAIEAGAPVQPVVLRYSDRRSCFSPAAAYLGSTSLAASLLRIAGAEQLIAHVTLLAPIETPLHDRRTLAATVRQRIQAALDETDPSIRSATFDAASGWNASAAGIVARTL